MTPGRLSKRVVSDRLAWVERMLREIRVLPLGDREAFFADDPWSNCPSEIAREEGRLCNECEFWGREVQGVDWSESSLCLFDGEREADELLQPHYR